MYGDKLKQAIDTINEYLERGETIALWDGKNEDKSITLDKNSELKFSLWKFQIDFKIGE